MPYTPPRSRRRLRIRVPAFLLLIFVVALVLNVLGRFGILSDKTKYAYVAWAAEIVPMPHDRLLVTDFGTLDRTGAQVLITNFHDRLLWKYRGYLNNPHSAYPMRNGDILIADTGNNRVIEVTRHSKIVWDSDDLGGGDGRLGQGRLSDGTDLSYPNDAKSLRSGDILISCRLQNRVVEITRTGKIVRDVQGFLNRQHNPDLLPNGNLLIADSGSNRVIEVNRAKRIVWQFGSASTFQLSWPRDANLLPNGNILITDSDHNRLVEVNQAGHIVHYWTNILRPYAAASLPNGNILVGDGPGPGVVELNGSGSIVWRLNHDPSRYLAGIPSSVTNGGFEKTVPGSTTILSGWHRYDALAYSLPVGVRATMVRDGSVHHGGRYSGRITYHGDSNGLYFDQLVRVEPGRTYQFSGWVKTQDVTACYPCVYTPGGVPGHTAEYEVSFYPASGIDPPGPVLNRHSGTSGWSRDTATFTVPTGIKVLEIDCYLRGQGTVWFDDVSLRQTG